jgi:hypothetical protein
MICPKIISVLPIENYQLKLGYETGEVKIFNVLPYMSGQWYKELYDLDYFKSVHLVSNGQGVEWGNGQDIAPHELYDMSIAI